jgi:drug/metabolite transporter (DMT)-like permease
MANASLAAGSESREAALPLVGVAAGVGAVLIWAGWIVATREAVKEALDPAALAMLRFGVPALVFAPVWLRLGFWPKGMTPGYALALLGSGAPFTYLAATAMRSAPPAEVGPLLPGTMPLIVALLSAFLFREKLGFDRWIGAGLVALGILAIVGVDAMDFAAGWRAHLLLFCAAGMWAAFTLAFKRGAFSAMQATAMVALWSAIASAPLGIPSLVVGWRDGLGTTILVQGFLQGVLSGVIAILLYGVSVRRLGASRGAALVALVPALAALLAIPVLNEWPSAAAWVGVAASSLGVLLLSGAGRALLRRA